MRVRKKRPIALVGIVLFVLVVGFLLGLVVGALDAFAFASPEFLVSDWYTLSDGTERGVRVVLPEGVASVDGGDAGGAGLPAVLLLHEWWGLDDEAVRKAELLAQAGFAVFLPDLYAGKSASTVPGALLLRLSTPEADVDRAVDGALDFVLSRGGVDPERVGVLGFCFGGSEAVDLAVRDARLAALVTAYGSRPPSTELGSIGESGPILGIFGARDLSIPLVQVQAFEQALYAAGREATITVYEGVGHAFIQSRDFGEDGAARLAWEQILEFLSLHLLRSSGAPGAMVRT